MIENLGPVAAPSGSARRSETPGGDAFALLLAAAGAAPTTSTAPTLPAGAVVAPPAATVDGQQADTSAAEATVAGALGRFAAVPEASGAPTAIAGDSGFGCAFGADADVPPPPTAGDEALTPGLVATGCALGAPDAGPRSTDPTTDQTVGEESTGDAAATPETAGPSESVASTIACALGPAPAAPTAPPTGEGAGPAEPTATEGIAGSASTTAAPAPATTTAAPAIDPPTGPAVDAVADPSAEQTNLAATVGGARRSDPVTSDVAPASIGRLVAATVPQLRSGTNEVRLSVRLDPPSLGHVTVDISSHDGAVHVVVRPSESSATGVLDAQRSAVSAALANAGFELGGFDVRAGDQRDAPRSSSSRRVDLDLDALDDVATVDDGALRL